jgi:uncharacterized protein (DUF1786 family)
MMDDKQKHGERFFQKVKKIIRKLRLAKAYGLDHVVKDGHRYHKRSVFNCGNPKCVMCMNPRKAFKEKTMQEKRFEQTEKFDE